MRDLRKTEFAALIAPDMPVCDVDGAKIGTVARVHDAATGGATGAGEATREDVVEVKAGFLGLRHLYIPVSAVQDVSGDGVFLAVRNSELAHGDWQTRPSWLSDLG
ncbi:MAG TPA: DUF2171 domain-containing protein [Chloroflexota bacterium]|nr:DUF2171 domain-containing protein [Chloroflexota bacterium]